MFTVGFYFRGAKSEPVCVYVDGCVIRSDKELEQTQLHFEGTTKAFLPDVGFVWETCIEQTLEEFCLLC